MGETKSGKMLKLLQNQILIPRHLVSDIFVDDDQSYIDVIELVDMTASDPEKVISRAQTMRVANVEDLECQLSGSNPAIRVA